MAAGGSEDYVAGDLRVEQGGETGAVGWLRRRALGGRAEFPVLPCVRGVLQQDVQPVDREIANHDWSVQERCGFDLRADARHSRHDGLGATRQIVSSCKSRSSIWIQRPGVTCSEPTAAL